MKKFAKVLLSAMMVFGAAACGSSANESVIKDVYLTDDADSYSEYMIVYYTSERKALTAMTDEVHFYKDQGYTADMFDEDTVELIYPDFDSYKFASVEIDETDDYIAYVIRFKDLDNKDNAKTAADAGLIQLIGEGDNWEFVDVTGILDDLKKEYTQIDEKDFDKIGLHFD